MLIEDWDIGENTKSKLIKGGYVSLEGLYPLSKSNFSDFDGFSSYEASNAARVYNKYLSKNIHDIKTLYGSGQYIFVNLIDPTEKIIRDPSQGYFTLLKELFNADHIITYKAVTENYGIYFDNLIEKAITCLSPRKQYILKKRYGFYNQKEMTYEDIGNDLQLNRERIRQLEAVALRNLHPEWYSNELRKVFNCITVNNEEDDDTIQIKYDDLLESLITREIAEYKKHIFDIDLDDLFSKEILQSTRFDTQLDEYLYGDIRTGLSSYSKDFLTRHDVKTGKDLLKAIKNEQFMSDLDFAGTDVIDLIDKLQDLCSGTSKELSMTRYGLDEDIFENPDEVPLTRVPLDINTLSSLLKKGFFYVSDYTEYYDLFCKASADDDSLDYEFEDNDSKEKEQNPESIYDNSKLLKKLLAYSDPMVRVKIHPQLKECMQKYGLLTESLLREYKSSLPYTAKKELEKCLLDIDTVREAYLSKT